MILVVLLYALLALTFIIAKHTLAYASPCFLIGVRMILAGILLCGYHYIRHRSLGSKSLSVKREDVWLFISTALFHVYLAFIPEFIALQYMSATKANLLYTTTPFISACIAYALHAEQFTLRKLVGIVIGLLSVLPIVLFHGNEGLLSVTLPDLILSVAIVSSAYAWFLVKRLMDKNYSLLHINGLAMLGGGIGALLTSFLVEPTAYRALGQSYFWAWLILLIITANILVYNLYGWLCSQYSITLIASAGFLCPVFGGLFGWWFEGTPLTWHYAAALFGIALGLFLYYKADTSSCT